MASVKDVALLAGVSASTVSRAINSPDIVDPNTLKRVQLAMKKLNYRPNLIASGLRLKSSKQIALIVPDAVHYTSASVIQHTSRQLQELGYTLILGNHHNQFEIETDLLSNYFRRNIDGIILYLIYDEGRAVQSLLSQEERRVPLVVVGRRISVPHLSNVSVDNFKAGVLAGEYLGSLGHKNVATVSGPLITQWAKDRLEGFRLGLSHYGAKLCWTFSQDVLTDFDTGFLAAQEFLSYFAGRDRPSAVWAQNDIMATGMLKQFNLAGLQIPRDLSLLGMDDIELATMFTPTLSTIHQPFDQIAQESIRIIMNSHASEDGEPAQYVNLEPTLIVRESTRHVSDTAAGSM